MSHQDQELFIVETAIDSIVNAPTTKSHKIRALYAAGHKKGDIARLLKIKYQHVRNVLLQPLKRA